MGNEIYREDEKYRGQAEQTTGRYDNGPFNPTGKYEGGRSVLGPTDKELNDAEASPFRTTQVQEQMGQLMNSIEVLEKNVAQLTQLLVPVLGDERTPEPQKELADKELAPLANSIRQLTKYVRSVNINLSNLCARIEV